MKKILSVVALLGMVSSSSARIMQTVEQCDARYGKRLSTSKNGLIDYKVGSFLISCAFNKGKCVTIVYSRSKTKFSPTELESLLAKNLVLWDDLGKVSPNTHTYISKDKSCMAVHGTANGGSTLQIMTMEMAAVYLRNLTEAEPSTKGL